MSTELEKAVPIYLKIILLLRPKKRSVAYMKTALLFLEFHFVCRLVEMWNSQGARKWLVRSNRDIFNV